MSEGTNTRSNPNSTSLRPRARSTAGVSPATRTAVSEGAHSAAARLRVGFDVERDVLRPAVEDRISHIHDKLVEGVIMGGRIRPSTMPAASVVIAMPFDAQDRERAALAGLDDGWTSRIELRGRLSCVGWMLKDRRCYEAHLWSDFGVVVAA